LCGEGVWLFNFPTPMCGGGGGGETLRGFLKNVLLLGAPKRGDNGD